LRLTPHKIVVVAAIEQSDYTATGVSLKYLFATPYAFSVKSVRVKRQQLFFSASGPLTEEFVALAHDGIDHIRRELILSDVFGKLTEG
jgi:hypothetical protein